MQSFGGTDIYHCLLYFNFIGKRSFSLLSFFPHELRLKSGRSPSACNFTLISLYIQRLPNTALALLMRKAWQEVPAEAAYSLITVRGDH